MDTTRKQKVFVGMSGGVDSSVTAALLKSAASSREFEKLTGRPTPRGFRGFDVTGVHIKMWGDESIPCQFKEDRRDALRVAEKLGIGFETWDLTEEYRDEVVNYMISEYAAGRTPNPDVMCNRKIKLGVFLQKALARGADFIATGHYVRMQNAELRILNKNKTCNVILNDSEESRRDSSAAPQNDNRNIFSLHQAVDINKDQSYFLWTLTQEQLRHCLFPLGELTKPEVRELAKQFGLSTADKPDSQGICFIGEIDLNNYLKQYIPESHGRIVTTTGDEIGEHDGLAFYTMGQREGLKIGGGIPYYVAKKDFKTNTLVVAKGPFDEQLFANELIAHDVHWIAGSEPKFPLKCKARIRYRQPLQECTISLRHLENPVRAERSVGSPHMKEKRDASALHQHDLRVVFNEPQRAVTPGQSIVFYHGSEMLGGAVIS